MTSFPPTTRFSRPTSTIRSCGPPLLMLLLVQTILQQPSPVHAFTASTLPTSTTRNYIASENCRSSSSRISYPLFQSPYGRGADIWPPTNENPLRLENSFPNGVLPDQVVDTLRDLASPTPITSTTTPQTKRKRDNLPRALRRILTRAASAQEETEAEAGTNASSLMMDRTPIVLAMSLVLTGMVRPLDALLVCGMTGYFVILFLMARSVRRDGITPSMPSLPPQGHVPNLVSNPLGAALTTYSSVYNYWLKAGAVLGLLAPVALTIRYAATSRMDCTRACARPLFFVCCQAISEGVSRRFLTPLPIRILIPVAYNTVRLGYLWNWAFSTANLGLGGLGRMIAIGNLAYWMTNLFGFLLPIATVRYMRAHFFAVEAEQVITRPSMEDSAGFMS